MSSPSFFSSLSKLSQGKICLSVVAVLFVFCLSSLYAQDLGTEGNKKPRIKGQRDLSTQEEQSIKISLLDLYVEDDDDLYPFGFSLEVFGGNHYTFSGQTVYPEKDFAGKLIVPVRVNDGEDNSGKFDLEITVVNVNDAPVITGQQSLSTTSGVSVTIQLSNLVVTDPDDSYPADFTLEVEQGSNYTVSGNSVTPAATYSGVLSVPVRVNDGSSDSDLFSFKINVTLGNQKPVITSQTPVVINEEESFTLTFAHLVVNDPGDSYPAGYTMHLSAGQNYVLNGFTVKPVPNFNGNLVVPVTVNDGEKTSEPFNFIITIRPMNDAPVLTMNDSSSVKAQGPTPVFLLNDITITDPDSDSLTFAEIGIVPGEYVRGTDVLSFANTGAIKGVFDVQSGVLALIGKASVSDYTAALKSVQYHSTANANRDFATSYFIVSDGQANSNRVVKTVRFGNTLTGSFDIPTAFTPNGDMVNDTWSIRSGESFEDAIVRVYTKSGVLVFESTGLQAEWDGQFNGSLLPADIYFYTVDLKLPNKDSNIRGTVTILR